MQASVAECVWCGAVLDLDDPAQRAYSTCRPCLGLPELDAP